MRNDKMKTNTRGEMNRAQALCIVGFGGFRAVAMNNAVL
jgi:hypothetical protein